MNPMLLENRKFAVRIYMQLDVPNKSDVSLRLVTRTNPLLVFHYNFGYVKRCGEFYDENKFSREEG